MPRYNGHKNWNHWNVSLWINNEEGLYRYALELIRVSKLSRRAAARRMLSDLHECGTTHTPDGAPYSVSSIYAALVGI